jgi:hypothetical protein
MFASLTAVLIKKIDKSSGLGHVIFLLIYFWFGSHIVEDFEVP